MAGENFRILMGGHPVSGEPLLCALHGAIHGVHGNELKLQIVWLDINISIPANVYKAIKPIYEELTSDDLLTRCIGGYTQNNNESFNSTAWALAPKSVSSGKTVLDLATNIAVFTYNGGFSSILHIMKEMGLEIGVNSYKTSLAIDDQCIMLGERSLSEVVKEARMASKSSRKEMQEQDNQLEGQLYGAGIAD